MANDLAAMKNRIADELGRDDLASQIALAIADGISLIQNERFYFNERRDVTISTVANQEFYTAGDNGFDLTTVLKFDYAKLILNAYPYTLPPLHPDEMERLSREGTSTGQPLYYCWYGEQFRVWPVPTQVYSIRLGVQYSVSAPASDAEPNNAWMTKAEMAVRSRAKAELYFHVIKDTDKGTTQQQLSQAYVTQLKLETNQKLQQGGWRVSPTGF